MFFRIGSFIVLSVALSTLGSLRSESAYSKLDWEVIEQDDYPQITPPSSDEKVRSFQGALIAGNWLLWPAILPGANDKESHGILFRNLKNGEAKRIDLGEPVRGLAWDRENDRIYARLKKEIAVLTSGNLEIKRRIPFVATNSGWTSIGIFQGKLFAIQGNTFTFYDIETGNEIENKELPVSKVSQAYVCSDQEIFLWYSEGEYNLHSYNPLLNTVKDHYSARIDSKSAPKLACRGDRQGRSNSIGFALMDPEKNVYKNLVKVGDQLYPTSKGNQLLKRNLSYRFSPQKDKISFNVTVAAKEKDSPETELAVVIPPRETAYQILSEETVSKNGIFKEDDQGNRTLIVKIPALSAGQSWSETVYSAKLTRFNIDSSLSSFKTSWEDWKVDRDWKQYLEDKSVYKIDDPGIVSVRDQLKSETSSVESYIQAVYKHITKNLVYKQDGRFDPAPVVLQNGHGSCTEHSYAQIALLRSAGIPARLAWNWLPGATKVDFNHKIAEVWHPSFGWIPMEPLAYPRVRAGLTHAKHVIFAVLNSPSHSIVKGGDVLLNFTKPSGGASRSMSIELMPDESVSFRSASLEESISKDFFPKVKPIQNRILDKGEERNVE
ncbi:transglutaminase domain-containing protein [Leptospira yasudae]|uniref:transglutaminase-like domain-containing protein n=1 Tax=Leptospira yasudae TaxID=2202201 RepID=UPI001C4E8701|nr:transglutaminase-like domain-containing protein [Leptospira yasudae]MBW0435008.1 transglutaminase domain-containing protein [Leptospira yasudae]